MDGSEVLARIARLRQEINDMDLKVKRYLSSRKEYPYPEHTRLLKKVRDFENRVYNKRFGFQNTEIELRLDSLMHSLMVHDRYWKATFEKKH